MTQIVADGAALVQGSQEWLDQRLGLVTASRISDVMDMLKNGNPGSKRKSYFKEVLAERLTRQSADVYVNKAMQWGQDHEDEAAGWYAFLRNVDIAPIGLVHHPRIEKSAASPDRLVGNDGLLEIKCPTSATHVETLITGEMPAHHQFQIQWQLACTGRGWCDFVSYDPRLEDGDAAIFMQRVERDSDRIDLIESAVESFVDEIDEAEKLIRSRYHASKVEAAE